MESSKIMTVGEKENIVFILGSNPKLVRYSIYENGICSYPLEIPTDEFEKITKDYENPYVSLNRIGFKVFQEMNENILVDNKGYKIKLFGRSVSDNLDYNFSTRYYLKSHDTYYELEAIKLSDLCFFRIKTTDSIEDLDLNPDYEYEVYNKNKVINITKLKGEDFVNFESVKDEISDKEEEYNVKYTEYIGYNYGGFCITLESEFFLDGHYYNYTEFDSVDYEEFKENLLENHILNKNNDDMER